VGWELNEFQSSTHSNFSRFFSSRRNHKKKESLNWISSYPNSIHKTGIGVSLARLAKGKWSVTEHKEKLIFAMTRSQKKK